MSEDIKNLNLRPWKCRNDIINFLEQTDEAAKVSLEEILYSNLFSSKDVCFYLRDDHLKYLLEMRLIARDILLE